MEWEVMNMEMSLLKRSHLSSNVTVKETLMKEIQKVREPGQWLNDCKTKSG
jgi:hypothetical protein